MVTIKSGNVTVEMPKDTLKALYCLLANLTISERNEALIGAGHETTALEDLFEALDKEFDD